MPSVSLAAEWVKVGGNKYNTAASDEAGTWSWDGADDLKLNNYNGGEIQAAGKLNVNYSGTNIVTAANGSKASTFLMALTRTPSSISKATRAARSA